MDKDMALSSTAINEKLKDVRQLWDKIKVIENEREILMGRVREVELELNNLDSGLWSVEYKAESECSWSKAKLPLAWPDGTPYCFKSVVGHLMLLRDSKMNDLCWRAVSIGGLIYYPTYEKSPAPELR